MGRFWKWIGWALVASAGVWVLAAAGRPPVLKPTGAEAQGSAGRKPAPDFRLIELDGKSIQLSGLKGKVVLLDFWATWCPPCQAEIPHFVALYAAYREKGLEIVGVSLDDGPEVVRSFVKQKGIPYPVGLGSQSLAQLYGGIRGIPTTFLIDKQGRIAKMYVGYQDKSVFESQIKTLLAE